MRTVTLTIAAAAAMLMVGTAAGAYAFTIPSGVSISGHSGGGGSSSSTNTTTSGNSEQQRHHHQFALWRWRPVAAEGQRRRLHLDERCWWHQLGRWFQKHDHEWWLCPWWQQQFNQHDRNRYRRLWGWIVNQCLRRPGLHFLSLS